MFFPISDENPRGIPVIAVALILINVVVFFISIGTDYEDFVFTHGTVPARVMTGSLSALFTLVTSMFLHGDLIHLIGNMWYLWMFGNNIEWACGKVRFLLFYLVSGVLGGATHILANQASTIPCIGASGAISGVLGGYLLLFPHNKIRAVLAGGYFYRTITIPAYFMIGFWFFYQFMLGIVLAAETSVAYLAHIGGFIAGFALIKAFQTKG